MKINNSTATTTQINSMIDKKKFKAKKEANRSSYSKLVAAATHEGTISRLQKVCNKKPTMGKQTVA